MKHLAIFVVPVALLAMMASGVDGETAPAIRAPQLGGVFQEQTRQLRLIEGIAGAASLGKAVAVGAPVEQAWLAPSARRAVVRLGGDSPRLAVADWRNEEIVMGSDLLPSSADALALSPSATAFALLMAGKVQVWMIGAGQLSLIWSAEAPDATSIAVNDSGSAVALFGVSKVTVMDSSGRSSVLMEMEQLGAMTLSTGSRFAVAGADSSKATIFEDVFSGPGSEITWESSGERVTALSFSGDNRQLIVGTSLEEGGSVRIASVDGRRQSAVSMPVPVLELLRAQGNAVYQISSSAKGIIYMIDADAVEPQVFVVPGIAGVNINE